MSNGWTAESRWGDGIRPPYAAVVILLLFVTCWLGIGRDLWTPDEPREAEVSREMWVSPSVVPTLNGRVFIEKPPLYYWTVARVFDLVGGSSPAAARSVSAVASFLTLLLIYFWGRRDFSASIGLIAALGLATSAQFMISSHWVLIDPLLMLFMTVAWWASWELIRSEGNGWRAALVFYTALVLALWTKGLIGPVLLGFGVLAYIVWRRSLEPVWRLHPIVGVASMLVATGAFAYLVYVEAGYEALREWFWVNHVLRFTDPEYTGHEQPFYYYLSVIPVAVLPWWIPFVDVFRPRRWRDSAMPNTPLRTYLASLCVGMALILSASSTKRGIYLLPMLPPLSLLLAAHAEAWVQRTGPDSLRSWPWWTQAALVGAFAVVPSVAGLLYLMESDPLALGYLAVLAGILAAFIVSSWKGRRTAAGVALGSVALAGAVGWLVVLVHLAAPQKDMSPFVEWVDEQIPADQTVYGLGDLDETFDGIVPFVTGRRVATIAEPDIEQVRPEYIVVQDKNGGETAPDLGPRYELLQEQNLGPGRYLAIWRRDRP